MESNYFNYRYGQVGGMRRFERMVRFMTDKESQELLATLIERSLGLASEVHDIDLAVRKLLAEKEIEALKSSTQRQRDGVVRRGIRVQRGLD